MLQLLEKFRFPSDYSDPPYSIYPESVCRAKPFDRGDQSEYSRTTPSFIPPQLPGNQFYRPFKGKFPDFIAHSRSFSLPFGMVIFGNEGIVRIHLTTYPGSFQKFSNEISTGYAFLLVAIQCRIHFEDRKIYFARTTDCLFVMCVTFSQWKPDPDTDSGKWCSRIEFSSSSNWKISLYCLASIVVGEPVGEENFCASWIDDNGNNWKLILYDRCINC